MARRAEPSSGEDARREAELLRERRAEAADILAEALLELLMRERRAALPTQQEHDDV